MRGITGSRENDTPIWPNAPLSLASEWLLNGVPRLYCAADQGCPILRALTSGSTPPEQSRSGPQPPGFSVSDIVETQTSITSLPYNASPIHLVFRPDCAVNGSPTPTSAPICLYELVTTDNVATRSRRGETGTTNSHAVFWITAPHFIWLGAPVYSSTNASHSPLGRPQI